MPVPALLFLIACSLYTGFQWTIQVLVYPQFAAVGADDFPTYEQSHQRRVSWAVGPLFAALALSGFAVLADPPAGVSRWLAALGLALVGAILLLTALAAVPLHGRLNAGFDRVVLRRLLWVDLGRLIAAVGATAVAVVLLTV
jgi:hypothetical protein